MGDIKLSSNAKELKTGIYEHYKKNRYKVLGIVVHSETLEEMVIYQALYGSMLTWVRPLSMFTEGVEVEGKIVPRFKFIGEEE